MTQSERMILKWQDPDFRKYMSEKLSGKDSKNSKSHRGQVSWSKGLTKETDERVMNISKGGKGHIPWNKGKKGIQVGWNKGLTKETDKRVKSNGEAISLTRKRKKIKPWNAGLTAKTDKRVKRNVDKAHKVLRENGTMKKLWQDPEYVRKMKKAQHTKPNKAEKQLDNIIQITFPGEFKINVLGNVMVLGGKVPDWVNVNGQKKLIEYFSPYWHRGGKEEENQRINYFNQFGWSTLIIWEHELENVEKLKQRILEFI